MTTELNPSQVHQVQLIQFLIILGQNAYGFYVGESCGFAQWHNCLLIAYMVSMLVLFGHFFLKAYGPRTQGSRKKIGDDDNALKAE